MKTIYKYPLTDRDEAIFSFKKFTPLTVQMQGDVPTLWAMVEDDGEIPDSCYTYSVVGTGWNADHTFNEEYVGTVQDSEGLVWHVYCEVGNG